MSYENCAILKKYADCSESKLLYDFIGNREKDWVEKEQGKELNLVSPQPK